MAILLALVAILSYLLSHLYRYFADRTAMVAEVNHRSAHQNPVPTGSGVVLMLVFCVSILVLWQAGRVSGEVVLVCLAPLITGILGYLDDRKELTVGLRLPVYIFAAGWCMYWLGFPTLNFFGVILDLGWVGLFFGAVSLLWLQNLFNFMDGIDGIAASQVVFVCFSAIFISHSGISHGDISHSPISAMNNWSIVCLLIGAISLGYLVINWPPAKVFMGDAGSSFFGLLLGVLVISGEMLSVWVWMILLAQFVVDACLTISLRLIHGDKIHQSHSKHAYQHLNRKIGTHKTLWLTMVINLFWLLPMAVFAQRSPEWGFFLLLLAALPLVVKDWVSGAGIIEPRIRYLRAN